MVNFAAPALVGLSFVHRHTHPARRLGTTPSDEAAMSHVNDDVGVGATGPGAVGKVVDLQTHTVRKSPANVLASLSAACRRLDVGAFDVYGDFDSDAERSYLRKFEAEVSRHFGKDDGVFCLSGGMAQSIVLAINARRCDISPTANRDDEVVDKLMGGAFACHPTCHLLLHENDAFAELLGMEAVVIDPDADSSDVASRGKAYDPGTLKAIGCIGMEPMRLSHVRKVLDDASVVHDDIAPRPRNVSTLILELPHREVGGKLTPWDEVVEISRLCESRGIQLHCDGARIFEASAGYG
jgi:threonine aldolase